MNSAVVCVGRVRTVLLIHAALIRLEYIRTFLPHSNSSNSQTHFGVHGVHCWPFRSSFVRSPNVHVRLVGYSPIALIDVQNVP